MRAIRQGFLAGALAGILLVALLFMDEGPANQLLGIAQALAFAPTGASRWVVALLVVALGIVIGGGFGVLLRGQAVSRLRAILWGLAVGLGGWVVVVLLLGEAVRRLQFSLYPFLLSIILCLLYGLVLGSVYATLRQSGS